MAMLKNSYIEFVDRIVRETGYDWYYVADKFNEALDRGVKPVDFFDSIVDSYLNLT